MCTGCAPGVELADKSSGAAFRGLWQGSWVPHEDEFELASAASRMSDSNRRPSVYKLWTARTSTVGAVTRATAKGASVTSGQQSCCTSLLYGQVHGLQAD